MTIYCVGVVFTISASHISELINTWCLSLNHTRKLMTAISLVGSSTLILATSFLSCDQVTATVVLLSTAYALYTFGQAGHLMVAMDVAPNFAVTIFGISSTFAFVASSVNPIMIGALADHSDPVVQYRIFFIFSAGLSTFCSVLFALFSTSDLQPWNDS